MKKEVHWERNYISMDVESFKGSCSHKMDGKSTSYSVKSDGLGQAADGPRIAEIKSAGSTHGCPTVNNASDNIGGVVSQRVRESLICNVDPVMEMDSVQWRQLVGLELSQTAPMLSESLVQLEFRFELKGVGSNSTAKGTEEE